jgi:hypothetical protein
MKISAPSLLILLLPAFLAGCESLSPAECATANWHQLGVNDGARGAQDRAASYYESCRKANIAIDVNSYRAGRSQGLQSYCRLGNAITEGLAGKNYGDVCPPPVGQSFKSIHTIAFRVQDTAKTVTRLQREQEKMQAELLSPKTADDRKVTLRDLLTKSDRQLRDARIEHNAAEQQFNAMQDDMRRRGLL